MGSESFEELLTGGHPNSLGNTIEVVEIVMREPARLEELYECYSSPDAAARLRTSNALKRIARKNPEWLVLERAALSSGGRVRRGDDGRIITTPLDCSLRPNASRPHDARRRKKFQ